ncbi:MAG: YraN family protein [Leptonema sp. (in: bacteria)]
MSTYKHPSEEVACNFLKQQGHIILEHNKIFNLKTYKVEIDIISFETSKELLHFIEVKNWNSKNLFIHPVIKENIKRKEKIILSYKKFIEEIYNHLEEYRKKSEYKSFLCLLEKKNLWEIPISFDLIWITKKNIEWIPNIFIED